METTAQEIGKRIDRLVRDFMHFPQDMVDPTLARTMKTVAAQAVSSNKGGKRLRARLLLAASRTGGAKHTGNAAEDKPQDETDVSPDRDAAVLDLACAVEIYQTSALVHDDIIDDSPLRRGAPSAHVALEAATGRHDEGTGLALMLGNMLATASVSAASHALRPLHCERGLEVFLGMQRAVETGQILDQAGEELGLEDPQQIRQTALNVYAWKTASYTTVAPLELGLLCAGMESREAHRAAMSVGLPLGLAFQLTDDLLDVIGDPASTGKPVGGDIMEGKRTILLADALQHGTPAQRESLRSLYAAPHRTHKDAAAAVDLLHATGSIESSRRRIEKLTAQSRSALEALGMSQASRESLWALCSLFVPNIQPDAADTEPHVN